MKKIISIELEGDNDSITKAEAKIWIWIRRFHKHFGLEDVRKIKQGKEEGKA